MSFLTSASCGVLSRIGSRARKSGSRRLKLMVSSFFLNFRDFLHRMKVFSTWGEAMFSGYIHCDTSENFDSYNHNDGHFVNHQSISIIFIIPWMILTSEFSPPLFSKLKFRDICTFDRLQSVLSFYFSISSLVYSENARK